MSNSYYLRRYRNNMLRFYKTATLFQADKRVYGASLDADNGSLFAVQALDLFVVLEDPTPLSYDDCTLKVRHVPTNSIKTIALSALRNMNVHKVSGSPICKGYAIQEHTLFPSTNHKIGSVWRINRNALDLCRSKTMLSVNGTNIAFIPTINDSFMLLTNKTERLDRPNFPFRRDLVSLTERYYKLLHIESATCYLVNSMHVFRQLSKKEQFHQ